MAAAGPVAMRAMFGALGFSPRAQRALTDDQAIDHLDEIAIITDEEVDPDLFNICICVLDGQSSTLLSWY